MKSEHAQLSCEAHECVNSIPELNNMVFAVQELGMLELQNLISILVNQDLIHNSHFWFLVYLLHIK